MHELEFFVKHVRVISAVQPCVQNDKGRNDNNMITIDL